MRSLFWATLAAVVGCLFLLKTVEASGTFAGALLLTPGFFTDALGFALLIPGVRTAAFKAARSKVNVSSVHMGGTSGPRRPQPHRPMQGDVIDGEYHELSEQDRGPKRPSGWTDH